MNFLLEITKDEFGDKIIYTAGAGDTFLFGAKFLIIGMVAVFAVLCLIWFVLAMINKYFAKNSPVKQKAVAPSAPAVSAPVIRASDDGEVIAAIAAAITMAESESSGTKFKVVSFKRI